MGTFGGKLTLPLFCAPAPLPWAFGAPVPTHSLARSRSEITSGSKSEIFIKFCIQVHQALVVARNPTPLFLTQPLTACWGSGRWPKSPATARHFEKSSRPALALHWRWRILQNSHENWHTASYSTHTAVGTMSTQRCNFRIV